jgi:ferredoxin-type protein NapG
MKTNSISRRESLLKIFQGAGLMSLGGLVWSAFLNKASISQMVLRPPAAIAESDFLAACIKCGACVEACPYNTLKLAEPQENIPIGTPWFNPRVIPCYMCVDVPCVPACPTKALDLDKLIPAGKESIPENMNVNMMDVGVAVVDEKSCIAFWGIQCDACYRACPLINEALFLSFERNERTGKHAFLKPTINPDICTGCGKCEHACVTEKAAIFVLPRQIAEGKAGDFYKKGWEKPAEESTTEPVETKPEEPASKEPEIKGKQEDEDYLNNWEELLDE